MKYKEVKVIIILGTILLIIVLSIIIHRFLNRCPSGYNYLDNMCAKMEITKAVEASYCDDGYNFINNHCEKKESINATINYSCPNIKGNDVIQVSNPKLNGQTCQYTYYHDPVIKKTCPPGCGLNTETDCICLITIPAREMGTGPYRRLVCIDGYLNGNQCDIYTFPKVTEEKICVEDFTLVNNKCQKNYYINANYSLSCPQGYTQNNSICERILTTEIKTRYECPPNFILEDQYCKKEEFIMPLR